MCRTTFMVLVVATAALVQGASAQARDATAPTRTRVVIYSPFAVTGALARGIRITRSTSGSCWTGSLASRRSDAWRCMSGNGIIDPCYSGASTWVACPTARFGNRVLRLNLTQPLPRNENPPLNTNTTDPAQVVLQNGAVCGFSTGATGTVAGLRLNYGCSNGAWLLGDPNRRSALWRILYLPSLNARSASSVAIVTAWW